MYTRTDFIIFLFALCTAYRFQGCQSGAYQSMFARKTPSGSSIFFQVNGSVYPTGYYYVTVNIGNPPKPYILDIDTGSHLTWVQCHVSYENFCLPVIIQHKPTSKVLVPCSDPLCVALNSPNEIRCESPTAQCDYYIKYADNAESWGVLVKDSISLQYMNGTVTSPSLAFGCGYDQKVPLGTNHPFVDGTLGLGLGEIGILNQLRKLGVTKKVVGHCLGSHGNGYLFFGDGLVPSDVIWTPMSTTDQKYYFLGTAELYFDGTTTGIKDLPVVFDSGSTYTYFSSKAYEALIPMLRNDIRRWPLSNAKDHSLPVCWKFLKDGNDDGRNLTLIQKAKTYFKPIMLSFARSNNVTFQLDPEAYLIITKHGNVCLGILNGTEAGIGDVNLIGDISFQDKIIIYDNEKKRIGFAPANCTISQTSD